MMECKKKNKNQNIHPLNDEEVRIKMKYFENLISELEWRRTRFEKVYVEDDRNRIHRETRNAIKTISMYYSRKEQLIAKDTKLFESRMTGAARLQLLQEKDKNVTDVVLAVHRRLGKVDHFSHRKAYRRILYALIVQGLCRLMEKDVVLVFRQSDLKLGKAVINRAQQKYKEIIGVDVQIRVSTNKFLPLESCGGVNVCSADGRHTLNNSLTMRLDQLLQKACPMIRIALYGLNKNRTFFDLSKMSGSPTLFNFPCNVLSSDDQDSTSTEGPSHPDYELRRRIGTYNMSDSKRPPHLYNVMPAELTVS